VKPPCIRCGLTAASRAGLCASCAQYRYRTGRDRPAELIGRALAREDEAAAPPTVAVETHRERLRRREREAYTERAGRLRQES